MNSTPTEQQSDYHRYSIEHDVVITPAQKRYFDSVECAEARVALRELAENPRYSADFRHARETTTEFIERHIQYLSRHPLVKYQGYISNLKLMTGKPRT